MRITFPFPAAARRAALALLLALAPLPGASDPDNGGREPVLLPEADQPAWNAIGRVNVAGLRRRGMCTGTLIAPDLVLTAAHCLYGADGRPARPEDVHFVAGWRQGDFKAHRIGDQVRIDPDFVNDESPVPERIAYDTGILVLSEPIDAEEIAALPPAVMPETQVPLALIGYRQDRPHALSLQPHCEITHRSAVAAVGGGFVGLDCPVISGASGAPVLWQSPAGWRVVAVVSASVSGSGGVRTLAPLADAARRSVGLSN
ncbi:trypsin-like serine peptidase [Tropicimonas sediminicola]|uniref:V8-like Glu-specific endopeptidase n=1 Tax=Tropicimonas sediminicola TaxID=1031541 RepID=A0A239HLB9_9RHOB|nr:trypsin-like peptidase domain-containing protein [Tropicimonas sediminicola]SNS81955.1 V8-like Glu-specific endopeptidase [Tropicimonas sediminicola]